MSFSVTPGSLHAVVGENGAGKTTLMKILYGSYGSDAGSLTVNGSPAKFRTSAEAIAAGIGMVSQHYGIIGELSCLENLILGAEGASNLPRPRLEARAQALAERMGFSFDWNARAETLSPSGAQKLEILKLLWRNAQIMILDEPTAMLSPADADALFASMQALVAEGATVLLVTHRLPEVMDYCQRVTVLRAGRVVADLPVSETSSPELARLIVGGEVGVSAPPSDEEPGEAVLEVRQLTVRSDRGHDAVKNVSFTLRKGEVVGVAGVDGNGQRELIQALLGIRRSSGELRLMGSDVASARVAERLAAGIQLIPEDRLHEGVIEDWSLRDNALLGVQRRADLRKDTPEHQAWTETAAKRFDTKHGGLDKPMRSLSGGNQQRFVAARALQAQPKVLLAFQPARGLDIVGTERVYRAIREHCEEGMAALVVSFDLDELLTHCDRILAMNHGELLAPPEHDRRSRDAIGRLMVGAE